MFDRLRHRLREDMRPTRDLMRLAWPIIGITVSRMLMSFIDFLMVKELGTEAIAAISPAGVLVFLFISIGLGVVSTVQTFASQCLGRGRPKEGSAYAWQAIYIALFMSLAIEPMTRGAPAFFHWIGKLADHAPGVVALEIEYTVPALWSFTPAVICIGLQGFFHGVQRPRIGLLAILISIVFNIVGNYALIFGNFGFEAMGMRGAAIATVIGWWVRAAVLFAAFLAGPFHRRFGTRTSWRPSREKLAGIARIGIPAAVHWAVDIGSWAVFLMLIMPPYGTAVMAASNIGIQFMHLSFMPAVGMGVALGSLVGHAIGEGRFERAVAVTRCGLILGMGYMGTIGLTFLLAPGWLVGAMTDDPEVLRAGRWVLFWAALFQISDAASLVLTNALRGAGDTKWPAIVNGIGCWGIFIGGGWAAQRFFPELGLHGPWGACTLFIIALSLWLIWRFRSGAWREIRLFADEAATSK